MGLFGLFIIFYIIVVIIIILICVCECVGVCCISTIAIHCYVVSILETV